MQEIGVNRGVQLLAHLTTKKLGIGTLRNANTVNGLRALLLLAR